MKIRMKGGNDRLFRFRMVLFWDMGIKEIKLQYITTALISSDTAKVTDSCDMAKEFL